ncbi:DNA-deoxyinosine glycosylase [Paenibacillus sp. GCM10027626]|uniref:DNA-deoxyinosine glycosylase n=1 Tax=Paenibacillus sp. GCM10027626 TaxID=3273411 RepID=UPI00362D6947
MQVQSFPPVIDASARILVLGSMPGTASLEKFQYYGHPRNYFWPILYRLFDTPLEADYERRLLFARNRGIALWDVLASCERQGSLDANIKNEQPNDILALLREYPAIRCLAFNGSKAYEAFGRLASKHGEADEQAQRVLAAVDLLKLPSTSPVPTPKMRNIDDRLQHWRQLLQYVC